MNNLRQSVVAILSGRVFRLVLTVLFTPILVRLLTQEEYGSYAYLMAIIGVATVVSPIGLFDSVRKHVAEHTGHSVRETGVITTGIILSFGYSLFLVAVFFILNNFFGIISNIFFNLLVIILLSNNLFQVVRGVFYGRRREQVAELFSTVRRTLYVGIGLGLAYYGFGVLGVIFAYTVALTIVTGFLLVLTASTIDFRNINRELVSGHVQSVSRYGIVQAIGGVAAVLLYKTDILLVEYFQGATETALYQAALVPAEYVWFIPSAIQMALLQNASYHWAQDDITQINQNVHQALKYAILALIVFSVGLFVLAEEFIGLYFGTEYQASVTPLRILLAGTVFFGINRVLVPVMQATGRLRYTEASTVIALVINVALNVALIPRYGFQGAAIATAISYASVFLGGLIIWSRTEFNFLDSDELLRLSGLFILFGAIFWTIGYAIPLSPLMSLVILPPCGFIIFLALTLVLRIVTAQEIRKALEPIVFWNS